jgi:hypothetical protein
MSIESDPLTESSLDESQAVTLAMCAYDTNYTTLPIIIICFLSAFGFHELAASDSNDRIQGVSQTARLSNHVVRITAAANK